VSEVVAALNEARVEHLVDDPELRYVGAVGGDGRLYAAGEGDGRGADEPRLTERIVERAVLTGARVTPVPGAAATTLAVPNAAGTMASTPAAAGTPSHRRIASENPRTGSRAQSRSRSALGTPQSCSALPPTGDVV
jgi:hypothetical protein